MAHFEGTNPLSLVASHREDGSSKTNQLLEDENFPELDEPPDGTFTFARLPVISLLCSGEEQDYNLRARDRRKSLLSQGLLTSSDLMPLEISSIPQERSPRLEHRTGSVELNSDGCITTPAGRIIPSPALPPTNSFSLAATKAGESLDIENDCFANTDDFPPVQFLAGRAETNPDTVKSRKRCITFACSRPNLTQSERSSQSCEPESGLDSNRSGGLRFAYPPRATEDAESAIIGTTRPLPENLRRCRLVIHEPFSLAQFEKQSVLDSRQRSPSRRELAVKNSQRSFSFKQFRARASLFYGFASSHIEEEEWLNVEPARRRKITVSDTLRKENAIRRLGEEAEAEALQEELDEVEFQPSGTNDAIYGKEDVEEETEEEESENYTSDEGNEIDDEDGFADFDDESELDSDHIFWTPGLTTAATSTDHLEYIRPRHRRSYSQSSRGSISSACAMECEKAQLFKRGSESQKKMRPGTPELPDSTDFVCGTLDEDRPLEAAYLSCLEQCRSTKHSIVRQNLDLSFPSSEIGQSHTDEDATSAVDDRQMWTSGHFDGTNFGYPRGKVYATGVNTVSLLGVSPGRLRSPPAPKRWRSPAPGTQKALANVRSLAPHLRSGFILQRNISPLYGPHYPPCPNQPSSEDLTMSAFQSTLRPNLTHTISFPRSPNPLWSYNHANDIAMAYHLPYKSYTGITEVATTFHTPGPIDIVQSLDRKRLKCKERFWRRHCRKGVKEKASRFQAGRGAERMRELGLEMANRCRGYGRRLQLVFSI